MSIVSISDIHVKSPNDERYQLLLAFMLHPLTQEAKSVYFLGDIFDLMVGSHKEYIALYPDFFKLFKALITQGKTIYFFEGNHDLHLKSLFMNFLKNEKLDISQLRFQLGPLSLTMFDKNFYFSHGDELEPGNLSYKIYKMILVSKPLEIIINKVAPYSLIELVGKKASNASRKRSSRKYNEEEIREKYRRGAIAQAKKDCDVMLVGHSHVKENVMLRGEFRSFQYINNGFVPETKVFTYIDQTGVKFISLV